ncbi:MAG: DUF4383 domain-containing protein [Chloroflexi bacterium]|nr:DUF4383 domain-containing protein [Chloroflexota bacterium]
MDKYLRPKGFLQLGGIILLVLGIAGFLLELIFPAGKFLTAFGAGDVLYFDAFENIAHTILGIVALIAARVLAPNLQKWLVALLGVFGIVVTLLGFAYAGLPAPNLGVTNVELLDDVVHFVVGVWALVAAFRPAAVMEAVTGRVTR